MTINIFSFKKFSLGIIFIWLGFFACIPLAMALISSFLDHDYNNLVLFKFTISNYVKLFNHVYFRILLESLFIATICTTICLIIGYPFAFIIARSNSRYKSLLLLLVVIPFLTSSLTRLYAITAILKTKGLLNFILLFLGITNRPLQLLYSYTAILIGCVYISLPFMILPLYVNIERLKQEYIEAARDLGANKFTTFIKVIIPLTMPGIVAGSLLVFLPAMTLFYIPVILGGAKRLLLGNLIESQFLAINNWPGGAAISVAIIVITSLFIALHWRVGKSQVNQEHQKLL